MTRQLNCFYDLSVAPCSYDFFAFLISAELHRIRNHFDNLSLIFLPGPNHGYREDTLRSFEQNDNFFKNVLLPGPLLLENCNSIVWLNNRIDAEVYLQKKENVFPRGFSVEKPISEYVSQGITTAYFRGENPVEFKAPDYAMNLINSFLSSFPQQKKFITVTTRELDREDSSSRKMNMYEWENAFKKIDKNSYQPLIIRDTINSLKQVKIFKDIPETPFASSHLHLRFALYQKSHLNFFKPNGPSLLSLYGKAPTIFFFKPDSNQTCINKNWYRFYYGMNLGSQHPLTTKNKLVIWNKENANNILNSINLQEKIISDKAGHLKHNFLDIENLTFTAEVSIRHTINNLRFGVMLEDLKVLNIYNEYLKRNIIKGPDIIQFIKNSEGKDPRIPIGTFQKIIDLDKRNGSFLNKSINSTKSQKIIFNNFGY